MAYQRRITSIVTTAVILLGIQMVEHKITNTHPEYHFRGYINGEKVECYETMLAGLVLQAGETRYIDQDEDLLVDRIEIGLGNNPIEYTRASQLEADKQRIAKGQKEFVLYLDRIEHHNKTVLESRI